MKDLTGVPDWARPGAIRYLRVDGGPCAARKARLSGWPFTDAQQVTLTELYTTHRERVFELLEQARVNWIWLTWSVGFSWETEAEQRWQCAQMLAECRRRGIHTTAYMSGNNMFWHDMFLQDPGCVDWLRRDAVGRPVTYFGQAERLLAQMDHPGWIALQKRRLAAALEAGAESFFYDNFDPWRSGEEAVVTLSHELRRFAREEMGSKALFCFNFMPHRFPPYIRRADLLDWTFCEGHTPPGVFDGEWVSVNPVHPAKYTAAIFGGRPVVYETCNIHGLDRMQTNQRTISPRAATLMIAEAAAFGSSQSFYVEGGFIHRLVHGNPEDLEVWEAMGRAYAVVGEIAPRADHPRQIARLLVICDAAPDSDPSAAIEAGHGLFDFGWHKQTTAPLLQRNIPFDFCDIRSVDAARLDSYDDVLLVGVSRPPQEAVEALRAFAKDKRVHVMESAMESFAKPWSGSEEEIAALERSAPYQLDISGGAPHVLGNVLASPETLLLHVVNYADAPATDIRLSLKFADRRLPETASARWRSPETAGSAQIALSPEGLQCRIPRLEVWGVIEVSLKPATNS